MSDAAGANNERIPSNTASNSANEFRSSTAVSSRETTACNHYVTAIRPSRSARTRSSPPEAA